MTAQDPDGNSITPTGTVTGPTHTFAQQGSITVLNAATETDVTDSHIVIGGKTNVTLAKYRFTAADEDVDLKQLGITIGSSAKEEVLRLRLFDGSTEIGSGVVPDSNGVAKFVAGSGSKLATVPKNQNKTLTVSADLNTIGGTGASSGTTIRADLTVDGTATFEAIGAESGKTLTDPTNLTLNGTGTMTYRKTKPVLENRPLPTSVLNNGTVVLMRFRVTADAAEQVTLKKLTFTIIYTDKATATDLDVTAPKIREVGAGSDIATADTSITADTASVSQTLTAKVEFDSEQGISAGSFRDFELRATVADAAETGDSMSTKMDVDATNDGSVVTSKFLRDGAGSPSTVLLLDADLANGNTNATDAFFIWSDNAAIPHSDTVVTNGATTGTTSSTDWINGFQVKVLPSDTQTLNWPS